VGSWALALALSLSPPAAGRWALVYVGLDPGAKDRYTDRLTFGERIERICQRESRCISAPELSSRVGIHVRDAMISRSSWLGQVRLEHLDPECQPYVDGHWATRGPWGLNAAVHWQYLPECYQPEILDIVLVSAIVAARKFARRCAGGDPELGWCG
jgi:hypothetical protein